MPLQPLNYCHWGHIMTTKQEIALDSDKLYGFKIVARDQEQAENRALSSSISSKTGDKSKGNLGSVVSGRIGSKIGSKAGIKGG